MERSDLVLSIRDPGEGEEARLGAGSRAFVAVTVATHACLRAVVAVLGPDAGSTSGFTWPDRYVTDTEVALCIGLSGTHVLFWDPLVGGWFCDGADSEDRMLNQACPSKGRQFPGPTA
ncbi:hypothetical protein [Streptomyces sp. NPDC093149]|uniref:hypothetical protein n=1 Tax=Streptomyces sp. NPDC093149 TaxID=3366031 RepID=UPI0038250DA5